MPCLLRWRMPVHGVAATWVLAITLWASLPVRADWTFTPAVPVSPVAQTRPGVFHHLESAGRKNIAVAGTSVAVIWEDNHTGQPAIYAALRQGDTGGFSAPIPLSAGKQAYEPVIVAAGAEGFIAAWEQDGQVWARTFSSSGAGPALVLDKRPSGQVSLASRLENGHLRMQAVWTRQGKRFHRVMTAAVQMVGEALRMGKAQPVDAEPPREEQLYPSVALTARATVVAWEDRRDGHTRLFYSRAGEEKVFRAPRGLNTFIVGNVKLGKGTGVTRVALAAAGRAGVAAAWMDKRDFLSGYDIYAAFSADAGRGFGANEMVQDSFGNNTPQWHPAIAVCPDGLVAVTWDDRRDGTPDVWLSWKTAWKADGAPAAQNSSSWSDDLGVGPASGPGVQADPVIACDGQNRLHLAWVGRAHAGGPTRVWYSRGRLVP